jgi:ribosome biogenesis GTPase
VSRSLGTGRHTTVEASLHPLAAGGYVADTPGLRKLKLWEVPEGALDAAFREFRPHLGGCRFPDCRHLREPDCAVRAAVERGEIAERRYRSYVVILAEKEGARPY